MPVSHYCVTSATLRVAMYRLAEVIDTDVHLVSTHPGGRLMTVHSGNVSLTWQHH